MNAFVNIMWFRRDLRLDDNAALYYALKDGLPVLPIFIFDTDILQELESKTDRRVEFIYQSLERLQKELTKLGSSLDVRQGKPIDVFKALVEEYPIKKVFANHDYEPYAVIRDKNIASFLREHDIKFETFKDQVIFEKGEVLKNDATPYTVFTPYANNWKSKLDDFYSRSYPTKKYLSNFFQHKAKNWPSLQSIGFSALGEEFPSRSPELTLIKSYDRNRNYPGKDGTTHLGVHLRFGTISIRKLVRYAQKVNTVFLNELVWREFYQMILWHFPHVVNNSFKVVYDRIRWRNNEEEFSSWCKGQTGYPIVDAGMRELNTTGFMHNRVRMVTASFLTKHLLIDWRWGEAYFAKLLLDYELASNNGNWQWVAGSGCDAAPYFRIFNPSRQAKIFDPEHEYINRWVPEWKESIYPSPIVEHEFARQRCLNEYMRALNSQKVV